MAISVAKHYYSDLNSIVDPLRILQSIDYSIQDQMEFSITTIDENIGKHIYGNNSNELQEFTDPSINLVDTKATWSSDFTKSVMPESTCTIEKDTHPVAVTTDRKRRMDWDTLDLNPNNNGGPTQSKLSNMTNGKDRERKTSNNNGRLGWADDIDFDLNSDLGNNGYLNSDTFLSLSSALTILKHEIPSPSNDLQKASKTVESGSNERQNNNRNQSAHDNVIVKVCNGNSDNSNSNSNGAELQVQGNQLKNTSILDASGQSSIFACENSGSPEQRKAVGEQSKFQYVLAASTSIATKSNEDTLTYLNQGQSYEIKLKKLGDLSPYRGKFLKSIIKICFHERRLQYMEREQMFQWQSSRPGERIVEIDVPLSYGLCKVTQPSSPNLLNTVEILWDPMKEVGVYIQVNCISTEFTPKKHGGEKGVPFRIQVETYLDNGHGDSFGPGSLKLIHAAACQIKVFKLKGADRKHKQDREKIQKRTPSEQEKYQPSYECTILSDIPNESITSQICYSPEHVPASGGSGNVSPFKPHSPVHINKLESIMFNSSSNNPVAINSVSSSNSNLKNIDQNALSPQQVELDDYTQTHSIGKDSTPTQLTQWLTYHRLGQHIPTFTHFSGADLLRMTKEDIIQICGVPDGIRMYNIIYLKAIIPRLKIYISFDSSSFHAIYLHTNTTLELAQKILKLPDFPEFNRSPAKSDNGTHFSNWGVQPKYSGNNVDASKLPIYVNGPAGIHVLVTDEVLNNIQEDSLFVLEMQNGKILMKAIYKNETN